MRWIRASVNSRLISYSAMKPTEELQTTVDETALHLGDPELGDRGIGGGQRARDELGQALVDMGPADAEVG